ncbi:MAG TPA: hypothetical protein VFK50_06895 [Sphingomicrobium sp.]|nr:hypothetical protein [Sphingomicrobium sp.]
MDDSDSPETPAPGVLTRAVAVRARRDGWTPQKQHDFIAALAESGCVTEAAAAVGMKVRSAYRLRARPGAAAFRQSWDIALDYAVRNLSDAAFSRALHGVATPIFFRGEQVGERRRFDERLTMFLLRYRDPVRYGAWLDGMEARRHPDGAAIVLANALNVLLDRLHGAPPVHRLPASVTIPTIPALRISRRRRRSTGRCPTARRHRRPNPFPTRPRPT